MQVISKDNKLKFEDIYITLTKIMNDTTILFFVDEMNKEVKIPEKFKIFDKTNKVYIEKIEKREWFILNWVDTYLLLNNNKLFIMLKAN